MFTFRSSLLKTSSVITPEQLQFIHQLQKDIKADMLTQFGRDTGGCDIASELLSMEFGWDRWAGDYDHIAHYWNTLPDGTIIDATHGQFGPPDLGIFPKDHPEAKRYHVYCSDPLCRHCAFDDYTVPCKNRD